MRVPSIAVAASLVLAAPAAATVYHVDDTPNASDSNPGTREEPWETIQHAVDAPEVGPGDVIYVHSGWYSGARITRSGLPGAPIALTGDPSGPVEILVPGPQNQHGACLEIEGTGQPATDWIIQYVRLYCPRDVAVALRNTERIVLRRNIYRVQGSGGVAQGSGDVLAVSSDDMVVEEGLIDSGNDYGIRLMGGDRPVIRRNQFLFHKVAHISLSGGAALGGDGIVDDAVVEDNWIRRWVNEDNNAVGIELDGVAGGVIRNNQLRRGGIVATRVDGAVCSQDNRILNNTVVIEDGEGVWAYYQADDGGSPAGCPDNVVVNNILWSNDPDGGAISLDEPAPAGFASRHNLVEGAFSTDGGASTLSFAQWQALGHGTSSQEIADSSALEALFVDLPNEDFHLAAGSDAIDAGELRADVPVDFDLKPRPLGATHDAGAYESGFFAGIFADGFESGDTSGWWETVPPQ